VPTLLDFEGHLYPSLRREPSLTAAIGDALFGRHFKRRPAIFSEIVRDERKYGDRHAVDWAVGAALVISAACDRMVGAWDERFFLYSEETDYAARVRAVGFRVEYVPRARALHRGAGSGQSHALMALNAVNRVRYFEKHKKAVGAMRAAVLLHELFRAASPGHRRALLVVSRRSTWEPLISSLKARSSKTFAIVNEKFQQLGRTALKAGGAEDLLGESAQSFDLLSSNSLMEHVGDVVGEHALPRLFAYSSPPTWWTTPSRNPASTRHPAR